MFFKQKYVDAFSLVTLISFYSLPFNISTNFRLNLYEFHNDTTLKSTIKDTTTFYTITAIKRTSMFVKQNAEHTYGQTGPLVMVCKSV